MEDEILILTLARREFQEAGFEVVTASDGNAAIRALESDPGIDVLFTDIRMPGKLDGWEVARSARAMRPELPVIYATGFSSEEPKLVEGAVLFAKPYRLSNIIEAARNLHAAS